MKKMKQNLQASLFLINIKYIHQKNRSKTNKIHYLKKSILCSIKIDVKLVMAEECKTVSKESIWGRMREGPKTTARLETVIILT